MSRIKEAFTDMAETLRRVFQSPPSHPVPLSLPYPAQDAAVLIEAAAMEAPYLFSPISQPVELLAAPRLCEECMAFRPCLKAEDSWERWAAGAVVCEMPVFKVGGVARVGVPPLPRIPSVLKASLSGFRLSLHSYRPSVGTASVRGGSPAMAPPSVRQNLQLALGLPIAVSGQAFKSLPKGLGMRYTLQLVRATGENIRDLEILGVYQIPRKGVRSLRHDARTGRILLELGSEASQAPRAPFILARKKDDRSYVSSFMED